MLMLDWCADVWIMVIVLLAFKFGVRVLPAGIFDEPTPATPKLTLLERQVEKYVRGDITIVEFEQAVIDAMRLESYGKQVRAADPELSREPSGGDPS